ncbi:MAG: FtsX-like permease family protein [Solirubrobacteraceae bacterium]|jgi:ABC-type antimicrobial peptide transport system permease subunit
MLAASLVVADSLGNGFDRAASAADLPDIIVRFDPQTAGRVAQRIRALPDLAAFSLRREVTGVELDAGAHGAGNGDVEIVGPGRRGYAVVAGRDLSSAPGHVLVERGLAAAWGLRIGEAIDVAGLGPERIVGLTQAPDNVSYPLAVPRIYVSRAALARRFGGALDPRVNLAQIWLRDPNYLDEVLVQARATSYGLQGIQFVTRSGVRVLLDQAAGIVIDLLVALSLIALATAGVMLAASARAEVQRRLAAIGVRRAVGASRGHLAATQGLEALLVAAPAATLGVLAGTLATYAPSGRLLIMLNEPPAGWSLLAPLLAGWLASVAIPVAAAAWPAWRAAGRPPVALLRGAELTATRRRNRHADRHNNNNPHAHRPANRHTARPSLSLLGAKLVAARRARLVATTTALGFSTAFVLLMLALTSALSTLETDPAALGKRYQLTAQLPASGARTVDKLRGVQAAAPRYEEEAADSFSLGESVDVIAYPGDHTIFEAPPLVAGSRLHGPHEAEVGAGLADALGLSPGSTLAIELSSGTELRLRVSGVVSSLDQDGRVAYVPATALLAADPQAPEQLAVRMAPGADAGAVENELGASAAPAAGATARGVPLVDTLRSILIAIAVVDGLVCVYALVQACALTVQERRRTVATLRAFGAGSPAVRRLLAGAVAALVIPAAVVGIVVERLVLGPLLSKIAADYALLPLAAGNSQILLVLAGLALSGAVAVASVGRQATRETVIAGLAAT